MAIDVDAPLRFLRTAFEPDDWVAILLKNHQTGGSAQRVGPMTLVASPPFQAWLRAENARRFSVFVSVNAIRPQRKARTREAIGAVRHVFLDVDRDGTQVLSAIAAHRGMPESARPKSGSCPTSATRWCSNRCRGRGSARSRRSWIDAARWSSWTSPS